MLMDGTKIDLGLISIWFQETGFKVQPTIWDCDGWQGFRMPWWLSWSSIWEYFNENVCLIFSLLTYMQTNQIVMFKASKCLFWQLCAAS